MSLIFCSAGQDINQNDKVFAVWGEKKEREINAEGSMPEIQRYSENDAKMRNFITLHLLGLQESAGVREEREQRENWVIKTSKKGEKVVRVLEAQGTVCFLGQQGTEALTPHVAHDARTPISPGFKLISALSTLIFPNSASLTSDCNLHLFVISLLTLHWTIKEQ